jgi:Arc/MetJ family transcription regulator
MARTNIDLDDEACRIVMARYRLVTKRDAVNFALRAVAGEPLDVDDARRLRGSGWDGDLASIRTSRAG